MPRQRLLVLVGLLSACHTHTVAVGETRNSTGAQQRYSIRIEMSEVSTKSFQQEMAKVDDSRGKPSKLRAAGYSELSPGGRKSYRAVLDSLERAGKAYDLVEASVTAGDGIPASVTIGPPYPFTLSDAANSANDNSAKHCLCPGMKVDLLATKTEGDMLITELRVNWRGATEDSEAQVKTRQIDTAFKLRLGTTVRLVSGSGFSRRIGEKVEATSLVLLVTPELARETASNQSNPQSGRLNR